MLHTTFIDTAADCSSTLDTVHGKYCRRIYINHHDTNHNGRGLCVTFRGAVGWTPRQLKETAQLTTELRNKHMIDAFHGMSGRMVVWEELRTWHVLGSVLCLFSGCHFNGLVFDGCVRLSLCRVRHHMAASPTNLEMHPWGPPFSRKVVATMTEDEAKAVGVVDMVDAVDMEDTVDTVDTAEAVEPETVTKVSAPIAKLTAIRQMHSGIGSAPRREETTEETTSALASSAGSKEMSKSIESPTNV